MTKLHLKRGTSCILGLVLVCLMVSASFVGLLDKTKISTSENAQPKRLEETVPVLSLDDMPLRQSTPLVYDSESDRIILFGGSTQNVEAGYSDTWSYDYNTNTWTNMSPAIHPPASNSHAMAYHSGADRMVLFGGHVSGSGASWLNHNETWTYDYNSNTWTKMSPAIAPPAMCGSMEYDSESDLIVLAGGWPDGGTYGDHFAETWTYNLTSDTWTNVTQSVHPTPRGWTQLTYDIESDLIVAFGGFDLETWAVLNDTWTYDTNTNTWTEISTVGPQITGDLVYDSESDRVVFQGGCLDMSEYPEDLVSETWQYDTNTETWEEMINDVKPPKRSRGEMAYDSESDKVILFSGIVWTGFPPEIVSDCWVYDLNNNLWNNLEWDWQEMTPALSPEANAWPAMTYDSESDLTVLFGGHSEEEYLATGVWGDNETWVYDFNTNTWTNMSPSTGPSKRCLMNMVYDEESDIIILFGGVARSDSGPVKIFGDTWTYDVNTNVWTNVTPATSPSKRLVYGMTYDSNSDLVILFGGYDGTDNLNDLWTFDYNSNTWTEMSPPTSPEPRNAAAITYDEESDLCVLFGGYTFTYPYELADTWVYNVSADTWTEMSPSSHPSKRSEMQAVYNPYVDRVIMFGGWAYDIVYDETWSYDYNNNTWVETNTPHAPSARYWYGLAFDSESNRTILFSGNDGLAGAMHIVEADTWAYRYQVHPLIIPNPPENLVATNSEDGPVLVWDAPVPIAGVTIIGYNVYRGTESGIYELWKELGDVLTYTDSSVGYDISYYYVVTAVSEGGESLFSNEDSYWRPLEQYNDDTYTFIVYGDTRAGDDTAVSWLHDDLVSKYLQYDPEMVVHSGDMLYHGGESYQWPLFNDSLAAIWEWDSDIEYFGAVGNHEWYTDVYGVNDQNFTNYREFFDYSAVIDEPGETELYYSFDRQGIHFIILNTVNDWVGTTYTCPAAQMAWLEADLAKDYETVIVSTHYPLYSILADRPERLAEAASVRAAFQDLFIEYAVDIIFTGHNHYYHRAPRDGIQYVTAAGGGAPLYAISTVGTDWEPGDVGFGEYHYCVCKLNPLNATHNRLTIDVVLLDGTTADTFNIDVLKPPVTTTTSSTTTSPTTPVEPPSFPMTLVVVTAGAVLVVVVVVLLLRKKK
ncbi:MAG: kelch repeat-containing protein [Candidatus Thorarchaeota archaeon]